MEVRDRQISQVAIFLHDSQRARSNHSEHRTRENGARQFQRYESTLFSYELDRTIEKKTVSRSLNSMGRFLSNTHKSLAIVEMK